MKYDDASWHYGGDFPEDLPPQAGATHVGMFLACAVLRDLASEHLMAEFAESIERVQKRQMTGADLLRKECDEKLTDQDLNEVGNAFAQHYYGESYLDDYCDLFPDAEDVYRVEDDWSNFDKLAVLLDARFREFRDNQKG